MPEPRISIHPVPLHTAQPTPPHTPHCTSISADGSVNGKYDGRNRVRDAPKKRSANRLRIDLRSTKLMPSSTHRPSICANAGACDASKKSRRYTVPGMSTRIGGGYDWSVRICTGEVCVRSTPPPSR